MPRRGFEQGREMLEKFVNIELKAAESRSEARRKTPGDVWAPFGDFQPVHLAHHSAELLLA